MRKGFQLAAIFLLLVGLPAGSWYYLQRGLDYRVKTLEELGNFGPYTLANSNTAENGVSVINFLSLETPSTQKQGQLLAKLHEQFDKRDDFSLITFVDSLEGASLPTFKKKYELEEELQCLFPHLSKEEWNDFVQKHNEVKDDPALYMVLVDVEGKIRNFYNQTQEAEVKQLVEHVAFLLPIKKRDTPELRREIEK